MAKYRIESKGGDCFGVWEGATAAEALVAMHRDAGYTDKDVWMPLGDTEEVRFASEEARELIGGLEDWIVKEVEED